VAFAGPLEGREFVLDRAEIGIGRRPGCDIVVPDQSVSRLHARIRAVPDGYLIEDAGSANGTWVNGVRLGGAQLLVEADVIGIGVAAFSFRSAVQATAASGPVTVVSGSGDETSTIDADEMVPVERPPSEATARPPQPEAPPPPPPGPTEQREPVAATATLGAASDPLSPARAEVAALERDLDLMIQQFDSLAVSFSALQARLARIELPARPAVLPALRQFSSELECEGGVDRYRELQGLLDELRSDPTDLKLLLRLSEELPAISHLVQAYLRALSLVREVEQG
jgi:pSer/pThr/pTyr-binding forkhead associated (FHA) protein